MRRGGERGREIEVEREEEREREGEMEEREVSKGKKGGRVRCCKGCKKVLLTILSP